jgi:hypothetical protein
MDLQHWEYAVGARVSGYSLPFATLSSKNNLGKRLLNARRSDAPLHSQDFWRNVAITLMDLEGQGQGQRHRHRHRHRQRPSQKASAVPTLRQAQGRLFRKGRERWGTHFVFYGGEVKVPVLSLQRTEGQGQGTRALSGSLLLRVECRQKKFQKRLIRERVLA